MRLSASSVPRNRRMLPRIDTFASSECSPGSKYLFFTVCLYFVAQSYMIPVACIGSRFALWPTLADFAVAAMFVALLLNVGRRIAGSPVNQSILGYFGLLFLTCMVWFLGLTIMASALEWCECTGEAGRNMGAFHLYRLLQFAIVYWVVSHTEFTEGRLRILRKLVTFALLVVCGSVFLSYFGIVKSAVYADHLAAGCGLGVPWTEYVLDSPKGWGTVSYCHAYTATQIILLVAIRMHLARHIAPARENLMLAIAVLAVFASGSRAGLVAAAVFVAGMLAQRPLYAVIGGILFATIVAFVPDVLPSEWLARMESTWHRQSKILTASDAGSTNGRHEIWEDRIQFLNESPARWLIGTGLGAARNTGNNAHNLYLHIILEMGLIGLAIWFFFFLQIGSSLFLREPSPQPLLMATIALLIASLTQETFYPVPAMGHFFGFYLACTALALGTLRGCASPTSATVPIPHYHALGGQ